MNETFFRALNLSNCLFGQANVAPTWGGGAFTGDDAPTLDFFLSRLRVHCNTADGGCVCLRLRHDQGQV
jgi:hypothetical protein